MPGWAAALPFQYLLRALAERAAGDSIARLFAAKTTMRRLETAQPRSNSPFAAKRLKGADQRLPPAYLAHEYLAPCWQPLYVTEVRADMAALDLQPLGTATLMENFDAFVLRRAERDALAEIAEPDLRELVRDYFLRQQFRRDVFGRGLKRLGDRRRRRELLARRFALTRPGSLVTYQMATPAGRVHFDNPVARAIVAALANGRRRLADLPAETGTARRVLDSAMALAAAGVIRPVGPGSAPVSALNRALAEVADGSEPMPYLALPCGTALVLEPALRRHLRRGGALPERLVAWPEFLACQGDPSGGCGNLQGS
jgi:hypothetical protein